MVRAGVLLAAVVTAAGVAGSPPMPAAASTVAVPNASFEALAGGGPACWVTVGAPSRLTLASAARTGHRAVQVRGAAAAGQAVGFGTVPSARCGIRVRAGRSYTVGVWYQATAMVTPQVATYSRARGWRPWITGAPYSPSTPWQRIETLTPAVPAGTELIALSFRVPGAAKLVLDDAAVSDATALAAPVQARRALFAAAFPARAGLVTNEYAYRNPARSDAARSTVWETTSGSLFAAAGGGSTGRIDSARPDARSAVATNSAVFRLRTRAKAFGNVSASFDLTVQQLTATPRTPATAYDGVHIWLRYRSPYHLYAVSVARRDGTVVIKKKCPGGPSNDGTYYKLGKEIPGVPVRTGRPVPVAASVQNNPGGTVTVTLSVGGRIVVTATDTGVGCPPLPASGAVGIRGDNTRFAFRNFVVRPASPQLAGAGRS